MILSGAANVHRNTFYLRSVHCDNQTAKQVQQRETWCDKLPIAPTETTKDPEIALQF